MEFPLPLFAFVFKKPYELARAYWRCWKTVGLEFSGEYGAIWDGRIMPKTLGGKAEAYWFYRIKVCRKNQDRVDVLADLIATKRFEVKDEELTKLEGNSMALDEHLKSVEARGLVALKDYWKELNFPSCEFKKQEPCTKKFAKWRESVVGGKHQFFSN